MAVVKALVFRHSIENCTTSKLLYLMMTFLLTWSILVRMSFDRSAAKRKKKSLIKLQGQLRYLNGKFSDNLKVPKVIIKQLVWSKKGEKYSKKRFEPGSNSWSFGRVKSRRGLSSVDLLTVVLNPVVSYQAWSIRTQSVESFRTHTNTVCFPCWLC